MKKFAVVLLVLSFIGQIVTAPLFMLDLIDPKLIDFITNELSWFALTYTALLFLYETRMESERKDREKE